jgi:pimeloyl-ACP methyl ester carboxylesterase
MAFRTDASTQVRRVADIDVCFRAEGDGRPVVLVHGIGQDHRSWAPQLATTIPGYRLVAYDVRGHGRSTVGDGRGTLRQLTDDLIGFLEGVTGPAICVGFSLGGTIVLSAAAHRADLVRGVVAIATSSVVGKSAAPFYRDRIALVRRGDMSAIREMVRQDTVNKAAHRPDIDVDAQVRERMEAMADGRGYVNAAEAMLRMASEPLQPLLGQVRCPVAVVSGERDQVCPRRAADIMLEALPRASFEEIPGVGHMMNVENPAAVTSVITRFLSEVDR